MTTEHAMIRRVKAQAFNETFVGGDDVALRFDFPEEWEVKFSMRNFSEGSTVWIQMSYEQAMSFALQILDAAKDSKRIYDEYNAYAIEEERKNAVLA